MKIVKGFQQAKTMLSRQTVAELDEVPPGMKQKLKEVFGAEIGPEQAVAQILRDVRAHGDAALFEYTLRIDGIRLTSLEIGKEQIDEAHRRVDKGLVFALELAAERIRAFHQAQKKHYLERGFYATGLGRLVGQWGRPLERVGVYAPGGTASYPSTVLMTAIPAKVAGVKEIILATPPGANGAVPPATLVAAKIAGVDHIFSVGGAQAIAGLAFGTKSIPKVNKVCGPGNIFVVLAKKMVFGTVDIDGLQGPSEVLIIADETANPEYCAADLLAQAEHDALAQAILVTTSPQLAEKVNREVEQQLRTLPRRAIAAESLENRGVIAVVANFDEAIELANLYAPEHLQFMVHRTDSYRERITNAGCIFIGESSPVAIGDYVAGPSHVLPTGGTARFGSPLNVMDFVKFTDVVEINKDDLRQLANAVITIARAEGLEAHARAVESRA